MINDLSYEKLNDKIVVAVGSEHRFGTDAFLLANFSKPRKKDVVLDLGTGCGIIPMILTRDFCPKKVYGVDIQEKAVEQFKLSVEHSEHQNEILPILCDMKELPKDLNGTIDVVTCNPPYKASNSGILSELTAEQIARHEVLCTIDDVCKTASRLLNFGGRLCICQRPERLADVITAMKNSGIEPKTLRFVSKNAKEEPWLFLIEGKKGARPFMRIMPPMFIYDGSNYTEELLSVYGHALGEEKK